MNKLLFFLFFLFVASGFAQENNFPTNGTIGMTGAVVPNTLNFLTTESPSWVKVGTLNLGQHGNNTSIKFYGGDGYNASVYQQGYTEVLIRTSNANSLSPGGYPLSAVGTRFGRSAFPALVRIIPTTSSANANTFVVFAYLFNYSGKSFYTVTSSEGSWTPANSISGDPGPGYDVTFEQVIRDNQYVLGSTGIGTTDTQGYKLAVPGSVIAESVKVKLQNTWPDYVFDCGHQLLPLSELETYVSKNKHLPDVPSADQVAKDGIDLADMNGTLLKKIEELTLYIIQLKNDSDRQQAEINRLKNTKR
ncbi:hypothetical protein B0I27_11642 [Arcticibacter pallidicorallinus]|uniref:Endosialidase-like protein n=1 Tax=Arcticibacter pallidicorallinus TaxID=1259464 RepID=A0A2T0TRG5_9SPHI|nr:hypothetical protein [Arcticibacter pallidicorallinus]PRY48108.1 hypothetical protein B0I27_11642 [Arcticibacter pallidicorallinus]